VKIKKWNPIFKEMIRQYKEWKFLDGKDFTVHVVPLDVSDDISNVLNGEPIPDDLRRRWADTLVYAKTPSIMKATH
jgi:gluconate kinase